MIDTFLLYAIHDVSGSSLNMQHHSRVFCILDKYLWIDGDYLSVDHANFESNHLWHRNCHQNSSKETKVKTGTMMLLTVCIAFLLFTLPITIYLSDTDNFDLAYGCCYSYYVIWPIFNMLFYLNNTANFLFYCLSGRRFRQQLCSMSTCRSNCLGTDG